MLSADLQYSIYGKTICQTQMWLHVLRFAFNGIYIIYIQIRALCWLNYRPIWTDENVYTSNDVSLHSFARNTRESTLIVFRIANYEGALHKCSPYFVGSQIWNSMPASDIDLPDVFAIKDRHQWLGREFRCSLS